MESPLSIMFTRNSNQFLKILWQGIGYAIGKIQSPIKCPTLDRLHCSFYLKMSCLWSRHLVLYLLEILTSF
jgi:hypothetical protein